MNVVREGFKKMQKFDICLNKMYMIPQAPSKSTNVQQPSQPQSDHRQPEANYLSDTEQPSSRNTSNASSKPKQFKKV